MLGCFLNIKLNGLEIDNPSFKIQFIISEWVIVNSIIHEGHP